MLMLALAIATMPTPIGRGLPGDLGAYSALNGETKPAATRLDLTVDASGAPVRCNVSLSDGNRTLDRVACAMLMHQAHFVPARDAGGLPVAAVVRYDFTVNHEVAVRRSGGPAETARRVDFALPVARLLTEPVIVADLLLTTDVAGRVTRCDVAASTARPSLNAAACREVTATTFAPARNRAGQAMAAVRQVSVGFVAGEVPH